MLPQKIRIYGKRLLSPTFPFDPSRLPFFYGWVVLALFPFAVVASIPGQTMGISVFTDSVLAATGVSRLTFSNAYLVGTLGSGLMLPWAGKWIDRYGVRPIALMASLALAATLWTLSLSDVAIARLGALPLVELSVAGPVFFTVAFFVLRFTGQGLLTLTSRTMIGRWFDRRRGLVAAGSGAVISFGFSLAPVVLLVWIEGSGWRGAWREMGWVLVAVGFVAAIFFRDNPEEVGLQVDGGAPVSPRRHGAMEDNEVRASSAFEVQGWDVLAESGAFAELGVEEVLPRDATRSEVVRSPDFWLLTWTVSVQALVGTAITFHIVDLGLLNGLAAREAVGVFVPIAVVSVVFGFLAGYLIDRVPVVRLLQLMLVGEGVAFFAAIGFGEPAWRWAMILGWGVAGGCYGPLTVAALPRLFGREHLGSISGLMTMFLVLSSALGPALFAACKEMTGGYQAALLASCGLPLLGLLVSPLLRQRA